ncbi:hypothetical protein A2Z22_05345 [Candidatus Woesebacteria bacterium RBG_16_34_12]|uniref:Peptidase M23 domain-containing protein n=1 Tax=Candidatus Woesebacteria bacterium RBG_16_34_12 TaxID=1802480 RepID=A0A1F7X718_9BACT|nr:MAG: hypothetical protein A2Z22_05345 [Candidatus Woesebacteria bacterium RBG_16_34_12]
MKNIFGILKVLGIILIILLIYLGWKKWIFKSAIDKKFITSSPIDLSQIDRISKFRSCAGHDASGINSYGEKESNRSMKHYAVPLSKYDGTHDQVKILAPFDGKIGRIQIGQKTESTGRSISMMTMGGWVFEFGHVEPLFNLKVGQKVVSGEVIGYYKAGDGHAFDLQLYHSGNVRSDMEVGIDSYISHLTPEVIEEYNKYSLTSDNLIISKQMRDQNECIRYDINPEDQFVNVTH